MAVPRNGVATAVPDSVPVTDEVSVIGLVASSTGLPPASCTWTCSAGENGSPMTRAVGPTMKTRRLALPGRMSNPGLVAPVRPSAAAVSVYPLPVLSIERLENVATPLTALTVAVPERLPPPGFVPMATVTAFVAEVTVLPAPSWMATLTAGVMVAPALVFTGAWMYPSLVAVPAVGVAVNGTEGTPEKTALRRLEAVVLGPSVHCVLARPFGLVLTVTGLTEPPPVATTQVIGFPPTPLPLESSSRTTSESARGAPAAPLCPSPETRTSVVGFAAAAVWVKLTEFSPTDEACALCGPATFPNTRSAAALPSLSVSTAPGLIEPPPATAHWTVAPATGLPCSSTTRTTSESCSAEFTGAV